MDPQHYRSLSLWHDTLPEGDLLEPRAPLPGSTRLRRRDRGRRVHRTLDRVLPAGIDRALRIAVLEKEIAGFGASGRNGGWASGLLPMSLEQVAKQSSRKRRSRCKMLRTTQWTRSAESLPRKASMPTSPRAATCGWRPTNCNSGGSGPTSRTLGHGGKPRMTSVCSIEERRKAASTRTGSSVACTPRIVRRYIPPAGARTSRRQ